LLVSTWVVRLDVDVLMGFAVEVTVAGTFVAAVEVLWLPPPHPASTMDATTPIKNTCLNPTPRTL
jgi:hypothetical protein